MNNQTPLYETSYVGFWIKVFPSRVEFKAGTGTQSIPINQIASIQLGMMGVWKIILETTGGKKYKIPCHKKNEVKEAIYRAQEVSNNTTNNDNVRVGEEFAQKKKQLLGLDILGEQRKQELEEQNYEKKSKNNPDNVLPKKPTGKGWMLLLAIPILVVLVSILFGNNSDTQKTTDNTSVVSTPSPTITQREDFKASVNFTGTQFIITNLDNLDCQNAEIEINGGLFSEGYMLKGYTLEVNEIYTVGALQFTKGDGTRLNPYQIKPKTFSIYCGGTNDLDRASWYGEFK